MNRIPGSARKMTFALCLLITTLLFGPTVAKADAVLKWNEIAMNTTIRERPGPFRDGTICSDCATRCL
jgi:hypothetical protein